MIFFMNLLQATYNLSQDMEFINELKSPQDIPEVVGVDWAASDRVLLACQDGGIRIMGLGLSGNRMDQVLMDCRDGGIRIMGLGLSGTHMDLILVACLHVMGSDTDRTDLSRR
jgi:hypothetical protein